jgi:hypothetical protein
MIVKAKISVLCVVALLLVGCNDIKDFKNLKDAKNQLNWIESTGYNSRDDKIIKYGEYDYKNLGDCEIDFWIEIYENGTLINKTEMDSKTQEQDLNYMGTVGYYVKNTGGVLTWMLRHDQSFNTFETSNFFEEYKYTESNIMTNIHLHEYNTECVLIEYATNKDKISQITNTRIDQKYYTDLISNNDFVYLLKFKYRLR